MIFYPSVSHGEQVSFTRRLCSFHAEIMYFSRGESRSHTESLEAPEALESPREPLRAQRAPEDPEDPETPDNPDNLDSPEPPSEGKVTNCKFGA